MKLHIDRNVIFPTNYDLQILNDFINFNDWFVGAIGSDPTFCVLLFMLLFAVCMVSFTSGITLAFPSILNPAILATDASIKATSNQASWIAACLGLGGLVSYAFMPLIFNIFGRKMTIIVTNIFTLLGSLIMYVANDVYSLVFARLTQGLSVAGYLIIVIILCECVSPKQRGYFVILFKVSLGLGSLSCHALGLILDWRQISMVGAVINSISLIILIFCGESPSFFALRGQFDKCATAFEWYRGNSLNATKELKELVAAQQMLRSKENKKEINIFKKTKKLLMTKDFQKSLMIVTLSTMCLDSCGRYFLVAYITQILTEITNNKTLAMHISVLFDLILVFALCISSFLVNFFKRRTLLFTLGYCSVILMFMVSLCVILGNNLNVLQNVKWLTPTVLLIHTLITNLGVVPIAFAITGEIFSLEQRGAGVFFSGIIFLIFFNLVMKLTPMMIESTGVEGTYSIYGLCLLICLALLQIILPETKDKSLQEIEDEMKGIVRKSSETELLSYTKKNQC